MKDIVIIGAGGFGREVQWLIERINKIEKKWNILGYIDDGKEVGTEINGYKVIGGTNYLKIYDKGIAAACAIGNAKARKSVIEKISENGCIEFPNLIDPSVIMSEHVELGRGNIICASTVLTVNIKIENFCVINIDCSLGHDDELSSYVTIHPSVNVSGDVRVGECSELGVGTQIIQGIDINGEIIIGAGSVVVKNLLEEGSYVGAPARRLAK